MPTPFRSTIFTGGAFAASGSNGHPSAGLLIYSASRTTAGALPTADLNAIGSDIFMYVSGVRGSKGTTTAGSTLFDGDVIVSGTIYDGNGISIVQPTYFTSPTSSVVQTTGSLIVDGNFAVSGKVTTSLLPSADMTYDLGSPTFRWSNMYTGDLHLRNERGDWTVIEEADFLTITNNRSGKRYKFVLEEID